MAKHTLKIGDAINKIALITLILLGSVVLSVGIISHNLNTQTTYSEVEYTMIYDSIETYGMFLRSEEVIYKEVDGYTDIIVNSGEKISQNQIIANVYSNDSYVLVKAELEEMMEMYDVFVSLKDNTSTNDKISMLINDAIIDFNNSMDNNDVDAILANVSNLKLLSIRNASSSMTSAEIQAEIDNLSAQIAAKQVVIDNNEDSILSPLAGYFVDTVDSYEDTEYIGAQKLLELKENGVQNLSSSQYLGKVITDFKWKYACVVSSEEASVIEKNGSVKLIFANDKQTLIDVSIDEIVYEEDYAVIYFAGDSNQNALFNLRTVEASIVLKTYEGLIIPKTAARIVNGELGVYSFGGQTDTFKKITPIYETESFYLISKKKDAVSSDILEGDKIVIGSKNLSS